MVRVKKSACPECGKMILHVRRHMKAMHPEKYNTTIGSANDQSNDNFVEIKEVKLQMAEKKPKTKETEMDTCGKCNEEVNPAAKFCPHCGTEFA